MKKTTMRIVGFLLLAAALVLATGCPQPDTPKKPEPAPAPSVTNFDVQQLKGMNFKVDNWNSADAPADDAYLCFSNEASTKLTLVAKDGTLQKRDAAVAISFSGNNVTIAELGINGKAFAYDKTANKITITTGTGANEKIVMTKSDNDLSGAAADADKVVAKFNAMMKAPEWDENAAKGTFWKITKYMNKDPGKKDSTPKEFYMVFDNDTANKVRFGSTVDTDKKKYANSDTENWTVKAILGGMQVSITVDDKIVLTDKTFTLTGTGTGTDQIITVDGGTVFTQVSADPLSSHAEDTANVKTALGKFADNE